MSDIALPRPGIEDEPNWQRLHPATLALALVRIGPRSLQFLPAVAALGFTGNWIWIVPAIGAFLLFSLLAAWFRWLRFRFLVGDDEMVIESGDSTEERRTMNLYSAVCQCRRHKKWREGTRHLALSGAARAQPKR